MRVIQLLLLIASSAAGAHEFLPPNNLWIGPEVRGFHGTDKAAFDGILKKIETVYGPIVAKAGGQLKVVNKWSDGTVNAVAYRQGATWIVEMYGGLARHNAMTADGVALVACHEVGHHLGGAPRFADPEGRWASVEGQSDYFSTAKCLRKIWRGEDNKVAEGADTRAHCAQSWTAPEDQDLCVRVVEAGIASANLSRVLDNSPRAPSLKTPDPARVSHTSEDHPAAQCRLDTYARGALCDLAEDSQENCTQPHNARPGCWFAGGSGVELQIAPAPKLNGRGQLRLRDPGQTVAVQYDVRGFKNAGGAALEISRPNQPFSTPNASAPDRRSLHVLTGRGASGRFQLRPLDQLPGWGRYYLRVIPLDASGRQAVGLFSDPATLSLAP